MQEAWSVFTYDWSWGTLLAIGFVLVGVYSFFAAEGKKVVGKVGFIVALGCLVLHYKNNSDKMLADAERGADPNATSVGELTRILGCCEDLDKVTRLEAKEAASCLAALDKTKYGYCRDNPACTAAAGKCEKRRTELDSRAKAHDLIGR